MSNIGTTEIERYADVGAVCLRQILTPAEVEKLAAGIEFNLADFSPRAKIASGAGDPGRFAEDFCTWGENPFYREVIFESQLGVTAGALMRSDTVRLHHDHMLTKDAGTAQRTPWHQDQPYYNTEGRQNVSVWIPVDPVGRESSLEFVAGSHKGPWCMPRSFLDGHAKWFPEGSLSEMPDIEAQRKNFPIVGWELEPGDAVCFHMLTLHASAGSSLRRRAFSVRFLGDDMRHAPRPWPTSPDFPELDGELAAGAPMDHPLFPVVWRRE
ncbi:MAG: phytanoyl-CoA dioxygenase family protein [Rhizomicrobium sp.]|jgi:ectoine hydroxylase-related dioxygenase (phytanoyl-CoA dioxygenase family)